MISMPIFTPEDFSDEHLMIRDLASQFVRNEVLPEQDNIEKQDWSITVRLLKQAAELGLVGIEIPERYGGSGLDRVSAMIVAEQMARVASFSVSCGGQSGIGTLPILYFGTEEQRKTYLPLLCSAEKISAYALSEAGSGSDALSAKTTAILSADGSHWILNGEKMWVTNAAFADVFITFAQVDGKHFSCFLVERSYPGVSTGAEERKMGLKGSSTRPVALTDVSVPAGNLIGQVGKGHEVALNILNIGRAKLGAAAVGTSKAALQDSISYARQRMAFGKSIASFGAIQHKLAEMAIRIWVTEGMAYRTAHLMDQAMETVDIHDRFQLLPALKKHAVECSIVKVSGSETLDYVVDEAVQIFGGYGFTTEYPVERYYRDSRVNRIFEGTNEINRLMISGMLLKRGSALTDALEPAGILDAEAAAVSRAQQVFELIAATASERYGESIQSEQEVLMLLADISMDLYAMDTAIRRARKHAGKAGLSKDSMVSIAITQTFVNDALFRIASSARQVLARTGNEKSIDPEIRWKTVDTVATRRRIAEHLLSR